MVLRQIVPARNVLGAETLGRLRDGGVFDVVDLVRVGRRGLGWDRAARINAFGQELLEGIDDRPPIPVKHDSE